MSGNPGVRTVPGDAAVEIALRGRTGVTGGRIPQAALDRVTGLSLTLMRPADLAPLARLRRLSWHTLAAPFPLDLTALAKALAGTPVTRLSIESPVASAAPLAALTGLTRLELSHTLVTDLPALEAPATAPATGPPADPLREFADDFGYGVRGVLHHDGRGDRPFPPNPWNVPPDAALPEALDLVWSPVGEYAPHFRAAMHRRVLALALLEGGDDAEFGTPALAYVVWHHRNDRRITPSWRDPAPPPTVDELATGNTGYELRVMVGSPPRATDPDAIEPLLAGPAPRPLRALWSVHARVSDGWHDRLGGALAWNATGFCDGDREAAVRSTEGVPPERLVGPVGNEDFATYALDLGIVDAAGDPTVVRWSWKEGGTDPNRPFRDWFDDEGARLVWL